MLELGSGRRDDQQWDGARKVDEVFDEIEEGVLGPMEILEDDDGRSRFCEVLEQSPDRPEKLFLGRWLRGRSSDRRDPCSEQRSIGVAGQQPVEARSGGVMIVALDDARGLADRPLGSAST